MHSLEPVRISRKSRYQTPLHPLLLPSPRPLKRVYIDLLVDELTCPAYLDDDDCRCLASGVVSGVNKFYFFAQAKGSGGPLSMAELSISVATKRGTCVFKFESSDSQAGETFVQVFKRTLSELHAASTALQQV